MRCVRLRSRSLVRLRLLSRESALEDDNKNNDGSNNTETGNDKFNDNSIAIVPSYDEKQN